MLKRWMGLKALLQDGIEHGSRAVERVQKQTAARTFDVLELIPPLAVPARGVRVLHDTSLAAVHGTIRLVTRAVGTVLGAALAALPDEPPPPRRE